MEFFSILLDLIFTIVIFESRWNCGWHVYHWIKFRKIIQIWPLMIRCHQMNGSIKKYIDFGYELNYHHLIRILKTFYFNFCHLNSDSNVILVKKFNFGNKRVVYQNRNQSWLKVIWNFVKLKTVVWLVDSQRYFWQ